MLVNRTYAKQTFSNNFHVLIRDIPKGDKVFFGPILLLEAHPLLNSFTFTMMSFKLLLFVALVLATASAMEGPYSWERTSWWNKEKADHSHKLKK